MDNSERLELRRQRAVASPAIFRGGFRPFFLGAGVWAVLAITIWLWALDAGFAQIGALDPLDWHRHEMLFGFVGAAIAGFALTAVPNWTGQLPIAGAPLAGLALWWLAARLLPFAMPHAPLPVLAMLDGGFYLGLALLILRETLQAKNRNFPVALVIGLFGVADILDYLGITGMVVQQLGTNLAIALATRSGCADRRADRTIIHSQLDAAQKTGRPVTRPSRSLRLSCNNCDGDFTLCMGSCRGFFDYWERASFCCGSSDIAAFTMERMADGNFPNRCCAAPRLRMDPHRSGAPGHGGSGQCYSQKRGHSRADRRSDGLHDPGCHDTRYLRPYW